MPAVSIENVAGHVGMGGLLDGQAMASIPADGISNDAGGGGSQDHDPIAPIVFDDVGLWDSVARLHDADVDGRTAEHQDPMRLVLPNAVLRTCERSYAVALCCSVPSVNARRSSAYGTPGGPLSLVLLSGMPHARQKLACDGLSCWHRGHVMPEPPSGRSETVGRD